MKNKLYFSSQSTKEEQRALEAIKKEKKSIGYYALPDQDVNPILDYCAKLSDEVETIAVIGIGGIK